MSDERGADAPVRDRAASEGERGGLTRRSVLLGTGGVVAAGAGAGLLGALRGGGHRDASSGSGSVGARVSVPAAGPHQAGVARPATPQPHALLTVADLGAPDAPVRLDAVSAALGAIGARILELTDASRYDDVVTPDGPGDLVVTVGLGPRILSAIDPTLPAAVPLPGFRGDDGMDDLHRGGDLLLAAYATDPTPLPAVTAALVSAVHDVAPGLLRRRWAEHGFRAPGEDGIARSPLGYHDGIRIPRTEGELAEHVWIGQSDHPAATGGTVMVLRRLVLDVDRFLAQSEQRRDEIVGRRRLSGAPLSGGERLDDVDLNAKTPEGAYLTPARSHARAAHPSFTGSHLMLRRSYAFSVPGTGETAGEVGLLFACYQRDLDTFIRTQLRLDETDDLMAFAAPTASASFLILPGYTRDRPLGSTLR
ncbi:Dyp-type peroxidase [Microbacterium sp. Marseille-Q6965]|uniref:Dyp-type peroxidase n=1 Tax=Microbacterium sp. Marseille-Q6965 TaxID=2965072 RepID=UPI0021B7B905|nr:Dyp-type peroxidase [Microbacterium sp. Marseille-Q6965]